MPVIGYLSGRTAESGLDALSTISAILAGDGL
jgi:hypothetical protein